MEGSGAVSARFGAGVREGRKVAPTVWEEGLVGSLQERARYPKGLRREMCRELFPVSHALSDTQLLVSSCIYKGCDVMLHCNYLLFTFSSP